MRAWLLSSVAACSLTALVACSGGPPSVGDQPAEEQGTEENTEPTPPPPSKAGSFVTPPAAPAQEDAYAHLDPSHLIVKSLLDKATAFFDANKPSIANQDYIAVVDFTLHSGKQRFFLVDMKTGAVKPYVVAHGKGSDPDYTGWAKTFSNVSGSNMSSLGAAVTDEVYYGEHGRSLRLDGVSDTNSNFLDRAIVIHGASYVVEGQDKQGRSLGCFALPMDEKDEVIDKLQGGALLYADLE